MLFDDFSIQSKKVIQELEKIKSDYKLDTLGTEHLLLALVKVNNSICKFVLEEYQITLEELEKAINKMTIIRKSEQEYSNKFKEVIAKAKQIAHDEKSKYIYDEHLVYSLLITKDAISYEVLSLFIDDVDMLAQDFANIFDILPEEDNVYLFNLTKEAKLGNLNLFIGRENLIEKVIRVLQKKQKNNPLLIGSAGVGKSSLVEGLAIEYLKKYPDYTIYRLDLGTIIAGTKYRGDLEERLIKVIDKIKNPKTIVFIDEVHNIMATGSSEGTLDIANILKPVLARNEIRCIGATTLDEYYSTIAKDKALSRRFHTIFIEEPSEDETIQILKGIKQDYQKFYSVKYPDEIIEYIVYRSSMIANRYYPDKAIDILDEVGLYCKNLKSKIVNYDMVDKISFDLLGIDYKRALNKLNSIRYYPKLKKYYLYYLMNVFDKRHILSVQTINSDITSLLIEDLKDIFMLKDEMVLKLELSKYNDQHSISNLLGSPKGYIGYESGGILTEHILKYPFNIVILKNYHLCNVEIKNIIDNIIDEGKVIDSKGRMINFRNTIMIFEDEIKNKRVGFIDNKKEVLVNDKIDEILSEKLIDKMYYDNITKVLKKLKRFDYFISIDEEIITKEDYNNIIEILNNVDSLDKNTDFHLYRIEGKFVIQKV